MIAGSSSIIFNVHEISCVLEQLYLNKFWFQTDLGCENSAGLLHAEKAVSCDSSNHSHALATLYV